MTRKLNSIPKDTQGWGEYWSQKENKGSALYDFIAEFYRKFIIRPSLGHFIQKYFKKGANIIHAGCGSGQVDADIRHYISITGLDISPEALTIYSKENGKLCKTLHASIFDMPLASNSIEGIYNLGVMEHFTEEDVNKILSEFHRVLVPKGRMVIFWPPEFGLSVIFLKIVSAVLKFILRRTVKLHPDEISRIQSKEHALNVFKKAGFKVLEYSFGIRDFFTYSVISVGKVKEPQE